MPMVDWRALRYSREAELYDGLEALLSYARAEYREFSDHSALAQRELLRHLSHSFRIDQTREMGLQLRTIEQRLQVDLRLQVFLTQSPIANAMSMAGKESADGVPTGIVLVTQHFLNDLDPTEQLAVLGHEIGHILYGHVHIPSKAVAETAFEQADERARRLRDEVIRWMVCCEISCDLLGLAACGADRIAFANAMLLMSTGLTRAALQRPGLREDLFHALRGQLDTLSLHETSISSHPLTPLRIRIAEIVVAAKVWGYIGTEVTSSELASVLDELTAAVDREVAAIYPELVPNARGVPDELLMDCGFAVALADGYVEERELRALTSVLEPTPELQRHLMTLFEWTQRTPPRELHDHIVATASQAIMLGGYTRGTLLAILRFLLRVGHAGGGLAATELSTILGLLGPSGISEQDVVLVTDQLLATGSPF